MLQKIFKVPSGPISFKEKAKNVLVAYALSILWLFFVFELLTRLVRSAIVKEHNFWFLFFNKTLEIDVFSYINQALVLGSVGAIAAWLSWALTVFVAPLVEELIFRDWPLTRVQATVVRDPSREALNARYLLSTVFVSSLIFGILHGSIFNIFLQGFGGLVISWVYLANRNSYWSAVTVHALYNASLIMISMAFAKHDLFLFLVLW